MHIFVFIRVSTIVEMSANHSTGCSILIIDKNIYLKLILKKLAFIILLQFSVIMVIPWYLWVIRVVLFILAQKITNIRGRPLHPFRFFSLQFHNPGQTTLHIKMNNCYDL